MRQNFKESIRSFCAALGVWIGLGCYAAAAPQLRVTQQPQPQIVAEGCSDWDPDCRQRILGVLAGLNVPKVRLHGGWSFGGETQSGAALRLSTEVGNFDVPAGSLRVLSFDALWNHPEKWRTSRTLKLRFQLAESDVLFVCTSSKTGKIHLPFSSYIDPDLGLFGCRPDERWGVRGTIIDYQKDFGTQRWAARWAEVHAVMNFLVNGNSFPVLQRNLLAFAGASVDTVGRQGTFLRGAIGMTGLVRSADHRLEIRGYAAYRPNLGDFSDYAVEGKVTVLRHFLFGKNQDRIFSMGLEASGARWSRPERSIGLGIPVDAKESATMGWVFEMLFDDVPGFSSGGGGALRRVYR